MQNLDFSQWADGLPVGWNSVKSINNDQSFSNDYTTYLYPTITNESGCKIVTTLSNQGIQQLITDDVKGKFLEISTNTTQGKIHAQLLAPTGDKGSYRSINFDYAAYPDGTKLSNGYYCKSDAACNVYIKTSENGVWVKKHDISTVPTTIPDLSGTESGIFHKWQTRTGRLFIDFQIEIWATSKRFIYFSYSDDFGETWSEWFNPLQDINPTKYHPETGTEKPLSPNPEAWFQDDNGDIYFPFQSSPSGTNAYITAKFCCIKSNNNGTRYSWVMDAEGIGFPDTYVGEVCLMKRADGKIQAILRQDKGMSYSSIRNGANDWSALFEDGISHGGNPASYFKYNGKTFLLWNNFSDAGPHGCRRELYLAEVDETNPSELSNVQLIDGMLELYSDAVFPRYSYGELLKNYDSAKLGYNLTVSSGSYPSENRMAVPKNNYWNKYPNEVKEGKGSTTLRIYVPNDIPNGTVLRISSENYKSTISTIGAISVYGVKTRIIVPTRLPYGLGSAKITPYDITTLIYSNIECTTPDPTIGELQNGQAHIIDKYIKNNTPKPITVQLYDQYETQGIVSYSWDGVTYSDPCSWITIQPNAVQNVKIKVDLTTVHVAQSFSIGKRVRTVV